MVSTPSKKTESEALRVDRTHAREPLRQCVREAVDHYFRELDGHETCGLFDLVLSEVEAPLIESVLEHTRGNYTKAATLLGVNRATLRKKIRRYNLD